MFFLLKYFDFLSSFPRLFMLWRGQHTKGTFIYFVQFLQFRLGIYERCLGAIIVACVLIRKSEYQTRDRGSTKECHVTFMKNHSTIQKSYRGESLIWRDVSCLLRHTKFFSYSDTLLQIYIFTDSSRCYWVSIGSLSTAASLFISVL